MADRTLFQISEDIRALETLLDEADGEVANEQAEAAIDKWFLENAKNAADKLDGYGYLIKDIEMHAGNLTKISNEFGAKAVAATNRAGRLKSRLHWFLRNIVGPDKDGKYKAEGNTLKFALQANGGKTPVELTEDAELHPEELPERYRQVRFAPKLDTIREDLELFDKLCGEIAEELPELWHEEGACIDWVQVHALIASGTISPERPDGALDKVIQANDLRHALQGVGRLGSRGEHLRIR